MDLTTAVIYFARNAREEVRHKVFCVGNSQLNRAISLQLYNNTHTEISKTGLPFFCFTEKNQQGANFAEKLGNAFKEVFEKGFSSVVAIGSDSPGITAGHITAAAQQLLNRQVVAGTTEQGGCYLIGMQHTAFDYQKFIHLSWQTAQLSQQIEAAFNAVLLLPVLAEVNNQQHLHALIKSTKKIKAGFRNLIEVINSYSCNSFFSIKLLLTPQPLLSGNIFGRAP